MITDTILILAILLSTILVVPLLCGKLHIPSIVGLILAGVALGPFGLGILERDLAIERMGQIGMLYVMFISGIEIDMNEFEKERRRSVLFGLYTFSLPFVLGLGLGYLFGYSWMSGLLIGAMMGSHTLMTYPVVSRYGIQKNRSVSIVIGGTILAVTVAMIILAGVSSVYHSPGEGMWWRMLLGSVAMVVALMAVVPRVTQWFFKRYSDPVVEYLYVLCVAVGMGVLADLAGLEPILGVFLSGLALNRHIPNLSPLMNKINFVGNAIFIPVFLLSVGMLVDMRAFVAGPTTALVAAAMCVVAIGGKWLAAWLGALSFRLSHYQRQLLFGLTNSHAAGALATVMIGYGIVLSDGKHLLGEDVLNGTVVMILLSCAVASFLTEHAAKHTALEQMQTPAAKEKPQHILLPVSNPQSNERLIELATTIISAHPKSSLHGMAVVRYPAEREQARRLLEETGRQCAASDHAMMLHEQVAVNISNGIRTVAATHHLTHIVVGMGGSLMEPGYGKVVNPLLTTTGQGLWVCHLVQPLKTIKKVRILVPEHSEAEEDYPVWKRMVGRLIEQLQAEMTQELISNWHVLSRIAHSIESDELLIVLQARRSTTSYAPDMADTPRVLHRFFTDKNYIVVFPQQNVTVEQDNTLFSEFSRAGESLFSMVERWINRRKK